jgi:tRNA-splicing ligase RtcB
MIMNKEFFQFGEHEANTLQQMKNVMQHAECGVLCADGHLGYVMPVGGVAAYKDQVSVVGVGFDIGCGNMAIRLNCKANDLSVAHVLNTIEANISFGIGQSNPNSPRDHGVFDDDRWAAYESPNLIESLKKLGRDQLGTVGSGNHYVDYFSDENGDAWLGVHFGSRGLGHKTASGFLNLSQGKPWEDRAKEIEVLLDVNSDLGERYMMAMSIAGDYAMVGREWVCATLAKALDVKVAETVHNHHNFAWRERHDNCDYIVIRKGATPLFPGQRGFVGGSMGDDAVILEGVDSELAQQSLYSTIHGAGRVMSRREAAGKYKGWGKKRRKISDGKVSRQMLNNWLREKNVQLRGGGLDESPHVYRRLSNVIAHHKGTFKLIHTLRPLGVVMAGENEFDPYRD